MGHTAPMSATPETFTSSLAVLGRQNARGRVGNPYLYLHAVGIEAVIERMYQGANLVDVAQELNCSILLLRQWFDAESYWPRVDEATQLSADGYLALGQRLLKDATTTFELTKARALVEHARWMASKVDKGKYGTSEVIAPASTVSYTFNVMGNAQIAAQALPAKRVEDNDIMRLYGQQVVFEPVGMQPDDVAAADIGPFGDAAEYAFAQAWAASE
jgi:hypothetical protein